MLTGLSTTADLFDTAAAAWRGAVGRVLDDGWGADGVRDPRSVGSHFGPNPRPTRELVAYSLAISEAELTLPISAARRPDLGFAFGHLAWVLAGRDDAAAISYYNPNGLLFSDDGATLRGAVGPRLGEGRSLLLALIDKLRSDPAGRRATLPLIYPSDLVEATRDFPCGLGVQFLVREERLWTIAYMRSQSAMMLLPYDIFFFRALQHIVAAELAVAIGPYVHCAGSFHVYEDEVERSETMLAEPSSSLVMPPATGGLAGFDSLAEAERSLREAVWGEDTATVRRLAAKRMPSSPSLWDEMRSVFLYKAAWALRLDPELEGIRASMRPALVDAMKTRD